MVKIKYLIIASTILLTNIAIQSMYDDKALYELWDNLPEREETPQPAQEIKKTQKVKTARKNQQKRARIKRQKEQFKVEKASFEQKIKNIKTMDEDGTTLIHEAIYAITDTPNFRTQQFLNSLPSLRALAQKTSMLIDRQNIFQLMLEALTQNDAYTDLSKPILEARLERVGTHVLNLSEQRVSHLIYLKNLHDESMNNGDLFIMDAYHQILNFDLTDDQFEKNIQRIAELTSTSTPKETFTTLCCMLSSRKKDLDYDNMKIRAQIVGKYLPLKDKFINRKIRNEIASDIDSSSDSDNENERENDNNFDEAATQRFFAYLRGDTNKN